MYIKCLGGAGDVGGQAQVVGGDTNRGNETSNKVIAKQFIEHLQAILKSMLCLYGY